MKPTGDDFSGLRRYITFRRTGAAIDREVDEELRVHIEMRAAALEQSGMSSAEARAQALREFGDVDDAARYCATVDRQRERRRRASDWISDVRQDVTYAFRLLRRAPAFTAATVLTLGLALGASTTVYGVLHSYLIRPLPYPNAERLVFLNDRPTLDRFPRMPSLETVDWRRVDALFETTARWDLDGFSIPGEHYTQTVTGAWVTPGFFDAFGLRIANGRAFSADEYSSEAPVAIISRALWQRHFGADPAIVGKTLRIHSVERPSAPALVTIVGILPDDFWPIHWRESDLLRPMLPTPNTMPALARLKPGISVDQTERQLDAAVRAQIPGEVDAAWHMTLLPALARHSASVRPLLLSIFGAALFMLLAACGSVAGALVSRMAARRNELAVRLSLGGSRTRVVRQLLTESAVLGVLSGVLGSALAYLLLDQGGPLIERHLATKAPGGPDALTSTSAIVLFAGLASPLCGIMLGLIPSLTFLNADRRASLLMPSGARASVSRAGATRVRRTLISGQVAVAMVLLFGAGLMLRTLARIAQTNLGFQMEGLVTATLSLPAARYPDAAARRRGLDRLLASLNQVDGVQSAAAVFPGPFWGMGGFPVFAEGQPVDVTDAVRAAVFTVTPSYFATLGLPLHAGRLLSETDDALAPLAVVISERLARNLDSHGNMIGRRIRVRVPYSATWDDQDTLPLRTIVGVVGDTKKSFETAGPDAPDVYVPYAQNPRTWQSIVVRTSRPDAAMIEPIRRAVGKVDPELPLDRVETVSALAANATGQRSGLAALLGVFSAFALGLCALALYASLTYTVMHRTAELAVRRAVGASTAAILRLVLRDSLGTALVGIGVGAVASLALGRVLESQLYGVPARDPVTLLSIGLLLGVTALLASILPAVRATRLDPARALRD